MSSEIQLDDRNPFDCKCQNPEKNVQNLPVENSLFQLWKISLKVSYAESTFSEADSL